MTNIEKLDLMITNMKELHHDAMMSGKEDLMKEYSDAIMKLFDLMDKEIENAAIADDGGQMQRFAA